MTRYRIPVLYWHRDSLFFTPLRKTIINKIKDKELWLTCHKKATTSS